MVYQLHISSLLVVALLRITRTLRSRYLCSPIDQWKMEQIDALDRFFSQYPSTIETTMPMIGTAFQHSTSLRPLTSG
jgi:hypothetical protein